MAKLIDKDALVAEIERRIKSLHQVNSPREQAVLYECKDILSFIDTLEVKDVDLEKEIKEEYLKRRCYGGRDNMLVILNEPQFNKIAKHFFELGMQVSNKAQKGE